MPKHSCAFCQLTQKRTVLQGARLKMGFIICETSQEKTTALTLLLAGKLFLKCYKNGQQMQVKTRKISDRKLNCSGFYLQTERDLTDVHHV